MHPSWGLVSPLIPLVGIPLCSDIELLVTEASHLRTLRVLDVLFYQRLRKESLLSREELALLFPNLPELIEIHSKAATLSLSPQPHLPYVTAWDDTYPVIFLSLLFRLAV